MVKEERPDLTDDDLFKTISKRTEDYENYRTIQTIQQQGSLEGIHISGEIDTALLLYALGKSPDPRNS